MTYRQTCEYMGQAGWISHAVAACNVSFSQGDGKKIFTMGLLQGLRTYQAFANRERPPKVDLARATPAVLSFIDAGGPQTNHLFIDTQAGVVASRKGTLVAFLSDIPPTT